MFPHHEQTIQRLTDHFKDDPNHLALIIGGSIVKGYALENSDVDFMLVVSDAEYARRAVNSDFLFVSRDFCDYPDGYVDGKIIDVNFLREVADHGSEPARSAFYKAYPTFSRDAEIDALLPQIPVYPEAHREENMRAFYSQVMLLNWFISEAQKRNDAYLMTRSVADLVLFGSRCVLAYNRVLYPFHKWLMRVISEVENKPQNFMALADAVIQRPGTETATAFTEALAAFHDWGVGFPENVVSFMKHREWDWREHRPAIHDW